MKKLSPDRLCVQVFAKVSAAISHEIKNTLSIINENAGLLNDYTQLAEQTGELPLDRVLAITETIAKHVDRSNRIMTNLNRYAHSADTSLAQANLRETLSLVATLTNRQAAMKEISVTVDCANDISVFTNLICLESLIYLTLLSIYDDSESGVAITVRVEENKPSLNMIFITEGKRSFIANNLPTDAQQLLAKQLLASFAREENRFCITFPEKTSIK